MSSDDVLFDVQDSIGVITFNRPDRLNALSDVMRRRLCEIMDDLRESLDVRVLVMTGAGRGFCAGAMSAG